MPYTYMPTPAWQYAYSHAAIQMLTPAYLSLLPVLNDANLRSPGYPAERACRHVRHLLDCATLVAVDYATVLQCVYGQVTVVI